MRAEKFSDSGKKVFNFASGFSLLVFYVFAMQCMSTIAIVYRETGGWKWPLMQLIYMTGLAWISAFITYIILS
jgi:ferrous iron transport protein B